jgi:hypothetical protein
LIFREQVRSQLLCLAQPPELQPRPNNRRPAACAYEGWRALAVSDPALWDLCQGMCYQLQDNECILCAKHPMYVMWAPSGAQWAPAVPSVTGIPWGYLSVQGPRSPGRGLSPQERKIAQPCVGLSFGFVSAECRKGNP